MRQNNMVIPPRTPTIEPTGGSDGTAVTMEQAFTAYRKTVSGLNKTQPARNFQTAEANESSGSDKESNFRAETSTARQIDTDMSYECSAVSSCCPCPLSHWINMAYPYTRIVVSCLSHGLLSDIQRCGIVAAVSGIT
jgi:hypothetical protein